MDGRLHRFTPVPDDDDDRARRERARGTFGNAECIRLPCPAARIATLSGEVIGSS